MAICCNRFLNLRSQIFNLGRKLHLNSLSMKEYDRRMLIKSTPTKDDGAEGEKIINIDSLIKSRDDMFPNEDTPNMLFGGVPFKQIPICNIRVSKNNTIISLTEPIGGATKYIHSCGIEGFKNTRKGTNIAAQATAITFATNAVKKGFSKVRLRIKGLGPGRMSAVRGIQMGGLNIISITDNTPVSWNPPRPRKQRKL